MGVNVTVSSNSLNVNPAKAGNVTVENSDDSYSQTAAAGSKHELADITVTKLDDTTIAVPAMTNIDVDNYLGTAFSFIGLHANTVTALGNLPNQPTNKEIAALDIFIRAIGTIWDSLDFIVCAAFTDDTNKLTDLKNGVLMTITGDVTYNNGTWYFQNNGYITTGFNQSTDHVNGGLGDRKIGAYLWDSDAYAINLFGTNSLSPNREEIKLNSFNSISATYNASTRATNNSFPNAHRKRVLYVKKHIDNDWQLTLNGVSKWVNSNYTDTSLPNTTLLIGRTKGGYANTAKISMFFTGASDIDVSILYEAFETFRTTLHPEILYNIPQKTGQTTSYRDGDDAYIETNWWNHFRKAQSYWNGTQPKLTDFTTLVQNNSFGNTNRFTDSAGGQNYDGVGNIADYVIDHYTGLGWYRVEQTAGIWTTGAIDSSLGTLFGGSQAQGSYTDWFLCSANDIKTLINFEQLDGLNYAPINTTDELWTSSTSKDDTANAFTLISTTHRLRDQIKSSGSHEYIFCRKHF